MKRFNSKQKVIIYGGAFNPPTLAHKSIIQACIQKSEVLNAEVWIMPSGNRPDKTIPVETSWRIKLIQAFLSDIDGATEIKIDLTEILKSTLTETIDTWRYLKATYPDIEFLWVFGADSINTMKEWTGGEELWDELSMLVIPRPGTVIKKMPPRAELIKVNSPNISSTMVREYLAQNKDFSKYVTSSVYELLKI